MVTWDDRDTSLCWYILIYYADDFAVIGPYERKDKTTLHHIDMSVVSVRKWIQLPKTVQNTVFYMTPGQAELSEVWKHK